MPPAASPITSISTACRGASCRFRKGSWTRRKAGNDSMQQAYLELKLSWELFKKAPESLSEPERGRLGEIAGRQDSIAQRILASAAAANVVVPVATLNNRLDEIRRRYTSDEEFAQDMARIGLDKSTIEKSVERDLRVEAVREKVASA